MNSFFTGPAAEFRTLIPSVVKNFSMGAVLPLFDQLAAQLLPRFLGEALAGRLSELDGYDPTLDPFLKQAYGLARSAVARLAFADYLPFAELQIGDDGVTVTASPDRKAAFEYQTTKLDKSLREMGWQDLDALLKLVAAKPAVFPEWLEAPYFQEHQDALFKSAPEFSKYYPIQDKWLTFWALRPFIQAVEENQGAQALARLEALPDSDSGGQKAVLRRNLLRSLAYQAVILALPNLSIELSGTNVQVNYAGQYANSTYYTPPGREMLDWVSQNLQKQADLFWSNFEDGLSALLPSQAEDDEASGLIESSGSIVWL
ncbi:DUF6712 family protein [Spirosoma sp.]|uniref:DUF6712 family protein n=1 Tax=Spirosoma sp. TaxID=1899569 RepID=UPI00262FDC31|nr:DUF6712 family protein [Spirosoma sp.]MCX6216485.1 hypothetical protein [Spirosoma sp.]